VVKLSVPMRIEEYHETLLTVWHEFVLCHGELTINRLKLFGS